jgi:hypothetical protein
MAQRLELARVMSCDSAASYPAWAGPCCEKYVTEPVSGASLQYGGRVHESAEASDARWAVGEAA